MSGTGNVQNGAMQPAGFDAGARRAADALLGQFAGASVTLRFPAPPLSGSDAEELGLPSPEFHDVALKPATVRLQAGRTVVLVSAAALEGALGLTDELAVMDALRSASFVQVSDRLFALEATERRTIYNRAYLYRLLLRDPAVKQKGAA